MELFSAQEASLPRVKLLGKLVLLLFITAALIYLGDWADWRLRLAHGTGMGQVTVGRLQVASMKGNKEEYFPDGTETVDCSRSIFPQAGAGACWWLVRHRTVIEPADQ